MRPRIPVNIIAGTLGAGKTTTVNHLLSERPAEERWAVLVNEYGLVGLDAALMAAQAGTPAVEVREVAGGCICCSAGFLFETSLALLLQRRPHRLLIEPTGLAALSGILDTLNRPGIQEAVDVRSVFCLLDPRTFREALQSKETQDQVEAADVLLASRADLATEGQLSSFLEWGQGLYPPKRFIGPVERGSVPIELLDLVAERSPASPKAGHRHGTDHHNSAQQALAATEAHPIVRGVHRTPGGTSTLGWACLAQRVFDEARTRGFLAELAASDHVHRVKAVLRTSGGWLAFNFAGDARTVTPSAYRRDSRLELIFDDDGECDPEALEARFRACISA